MNKNHLVQDDIYLERFKWCSLFTGHWYFNIELPSSDVDPLVTTEGEREVEPHVTVDTDVLLLQVGLLVRFLVLQAAVAQVTVVALEKLQPLKPSLRASPPGLRLIHLGRPTAGPTGGPGGSRRILTVWLCVGRLNQFQVGRLCLQIDGQIKINRYG